MSTENKTNPAEPARSMAPRGAARRRLTKAGLGVAGVLWTAQSRADMTLIKGCASPSAALSGDLDSKSPSFSPCGGKSPGYWKNHGGWPCSRDLPFSSVFGCAEWNSSSYGIVTMSQLLNHCDFDTHNFGMHLVASYLNVESGRIAFLSVQTLMKMWSQLQRHGHYEPVRNVFWTAEKTKEYLESTYESKDDKGDKRG